MKDYYEIKDYTNLKKAFIYIPPGHMLLAHSKLIMGHGGSSGENNTLLPGVMKDANTVANSQSKTQTSTRSKRGRKGVSKPIKKKGSKQITHLCFHAYIGVGNAKKDTGGFEDTVSVNIDDSKFETTK